MTAEIATSSRTRTVRAIAWVGLVAFAAVRSLLLLSGPEAPAARALAEVAYLAPLLLACVSAAVASARCSGGERRFWSFLAGSLGLVLVSEAYYSYYTIYVDPAGPTMPAPFELLQVAAILVFFAMVVSMGRFGTATHTQRIRFFTGASAGLVALFVAALEFVVVPLFDGLPGVTEAEVVISAVYPVLGAAFLAATFGVLFGVRYERWRPWEWLVITALTLYAVGMFLMPFWYRATLMNAPQTQLGALAEVGLSVGPYLMFMAALYRLTSKDPTDALVPGPLLDVSPAWLRIGYQVTLAFLVPVVGVHVSTHAGQLHATVLMVSALLLATLLLVRSWLASLEVAQHQQLSSRDALTGLGNERALRAALPLSIDEAVRYGGQLAFVVLDVDDLTRINELFGHAVGDEVMRGVAAVLANACGTDCLVYRIGSDEFALAAPGLSPEESRDLARSISRSVERDISARGLTVTVSAGVSSLRTSPDTEALISDAFTALQTAKLLQRGSVSVFGERSPVLPGPDERLELARKESYLSTMRALAAAVDARDPAAREHSRRVGRLSRKLGEELGLDALHLSALETAAFVHDIGKLALPDELLWKHGALTEDELARVREHVELGERILRSTELAFMLPWVRAHHERWDGSGYPDGLAGEAIPLEARIIAVCDSYDRMRSGISQDSPFGAEAALQEIDFSIGTHFDPRVAEAFISMRSRDVDESEAPRWT